MNHNIACAAVCFENFRSFVFVEEKEKKMKVEKKHDSLQLSLSTRPPQKRIFARLHLWKEKENIGNQKRASTQPA